MVQNRSWEGEPEAYVAKALALDARHVPTLYLAGNIAFQKGELATAKRHWETLCPLPSQAASGRVPCRRV